MKPAVVKYNGIDNDRFTHGHLYDAYFLEYWEGKRDSMHVRGDDGDITDFNHFEDFSIVSDEDNLLNDYEAIVRSISHKTDEIIGGLTFGKEYRAIGRDKDGMFLVMDDSFCCYFYNPDNFEIIDDPHGILERQSVYYSYSGGKNAILG